MDDKGIKKLNSPEQMAQKIIGKNGHAVWKKYISIKNV